MNAVRSGLGAALAPLLCVAAFAQPAAFDPEGDAAPGASRVSPSRVLAGLRGYSDQVVEAFVELAEHPQVLAGISAAVQMGNELDASALEAPPQLRQSLELLGRAPEVLALTAMHPWELGLLHALWSVAPEGAASRLDQLRQGYDREAREAARAWQRALEQDPVALGQYRDLLTRFCRATQEMVPGLACVRVVDRRYYGACPPDEAVVLFTSEADIPHALSRVLAAWWSQYAPQHVDARVIQTRASALAPLEADECVYTWPVEQRAAMWQSVEADETHEGLGLVPVALQPLADQPSRARLAWAVAEHARLWSAPVPVVTLPSWEDAAALTPEPEEPAIVIEEAIPGPQSARREALDIDVSERIPTDYVGPRYAGTYGGYWMAGPQYGLTYYTYSPRWVYGADDIFYPGRVYSTGGVYLHGGRGGTWRVYAPARYGPVYRRGTTSRGHVSVSVGERSYHPRHVYVRPRNLHDVPQGHRVQTHHRTPQRQVVVRRAPTVRTGQRHPGLRTLRSGVRSTIRSAIPSKVRSRIGGIRQAVRNKLHKIRSGNSNRSGSRATRSPSRSGARSGVRRR